MGSSVPNTYGLVYRARDNAGAVGRECYRPDHVRVSLEWPSNEITTTCVPHTDGEVRRARDDASVVGREPHTVDRLGVPHEWPSREKPGVCVARLYLILASCGYVMRVKVYSYE